MRQQHHSATRHGRRSQPLRSPVRPLLYPRRSRPHAKGGVDDPAKIPPETYRIAAEFPIGLTCTVTIAVAAACRAKAFSALRELLDADKALQTELRVHLLHIVLAYLSVAETLEPHVILVTTAGDEPLDPPLDPTGPPWRILDD
jgi:hypothetical protein